MQMKVSVRLGEEKKETRSDRRDKRSLLLAASSASGRALEMKAAGGSHFASAPNQRKRLIIDN